MISLLSIQDARGHGLPGTPISRVRERLRRSPEGFEGPIDRSLGRDLDRLTDRLARVRARGGEFAGVEFAPDLAQEVARSARPGCSCLAPGADAGLTGGGDPRHTPVLLEEVLRLMAPAVGEAYLDLTIGCGGHAVAIAERLGPEGRIVGIDRDAEALEIARDALEGRGPVLLRGSFGELGSLRHSLPVPAFDLVLADLGVSSLQLDEARRGFSFRREGPLDMRMDPEKGRSAEALVNEADVGELTRVITDYGEERHARRIAEAIVRERRGHPIRTTTALSEVIHKVMPRQRRDAIDPSTRTFQALRIAVNGELDALDHLLEHFDPLLRPGGRFAVIAYHSLEDRRVKDAFRRRAREGDHLLLTRRPVRPTDEEIATNPRARSARLRVIARREGRAA